MLTFVGPLFLACVLSIFSSAFVLKKERTQTTLWFSILMMTVLLWSLFYALEIMFFDEGVTLVFAKLKYIGIVFAPVAWCFFSLSYTRKTYSISKISILGLSIIPIISLSMLFSNSFHHLFWKSFSLAGNNSLRIISADSYIFFWFHTYYSYVLILIGTSLILLMLLRSKDIFTKQNLALLIGVLTPFMGNILIVFDLVRLPFGYDLTPVLFVISGLSFSFAVVYYKFLELIPAARDEIFEHFTQAIFVLNKNLKIVDMNAAADNLLKEGYLSIPTASSNLIGAQIDLIFDDIFIEGILQETGITSKTINVTGGTDEKWFDVSMKPLFDNRKRLEGHLVTLDDITMQKNAELELHKKINELRQFKQVTTDRELKMIELKNQINELKKELQGDD